jgi:hypothetical protein
MGRCSTGKHGRRPYEKSKTIAGLASGFSTCRVLVRLVEIHGFKERQVKFSLVCAIALFLTILATNAHAIGQDQPKEKPPTTAAKFPKCTDPLPDVAVPEAPHGLFAIMFPDPQKQAKTTKLLVHNPVVCGANFYLVWNEIDRGPNASPRYDWSAVDERMGPWLAAGKRVNLVMWATGYNGRSKATPDYVFEKVNSVECPNFGRVPVFWEKDFMKNYQAFMAAAVEKYGSNPQVGYIRFGLGGGGETYPACMFALKRHGFSAGVWRKYILEMLDFEKTLNSQKQLMVGINSFGQPEDLGFADAVAERAMRNGIAFGSQSLSMEDSRNEESGSPCAVDWCRNFHKFQGKVPLELQTRKASNPGGGGLVGSMTELLPFAIRMKTQIIEIYPEDWYVAYDPSSPDYEQHHEEYQKAYEAAAKVLGGN